MMSKGRLGMIVMRPNNKVTEKVSVNLLANDVSESIVMMPPLD